MSTAAAALAGVLELADAAGEHDGPSRVDPVVAADVLATRSSPLTVAAHAFTFGGSELVVGGIAVMVLAGLLLRRRTLQAIVFALGIGGSVALTVAVKLWVARPRPGSVDRLGPVDRSYSFPSGHTLNSVVLLVLVVWLLWPGAGAARRAILSGAALLAAAGVGASRVYLGYHWLTDVAASGLIAIGWLSVVWLVRPQVERVVARAVPTRRGSAETAMVPDVRCRPPGASWASVAARPSRDAQAPRPHPFAPEASSGPGQVAACTVALVTTTKALPRTRRQMLNKVPEVTIFFWLIKILCTTVGESFADYINETLGFGLTNTTLVFSVALVAVLVAQFRAVRYVPGIYWLAVVLISVVGTLLTDNLTDGHGVPLWISSTVFAVLLAAAFGAWYARERTLSIHSITTTPRESWYWLVVLVTFALGTAVGDWTLEFTGWSPGASILLPLGLILAVLAAWKVGMGPVLSFWLAYILTRPLGANIGDFLSSPHTDGGLGLGTLWTSVIFLGTILATVVYLTLTRIDRTETVRGDDDGTSRSAVGD